MITDYKIIFNPIDSEGLKENNFTTPTKQIKFAGHSSLCLTFHRHFSLA